MTDWKSSLRSDPMPWLLENACPAIRYRVLTELLELGRDNLCLLYTSDAADDLVSV